MHDIAPVTGAGNDELELSRQDKSGKTTFAAAQDNQERITMKWASMWRSIMLSGLDKTLFPYSHFIRALQLQDLQDLLQDDKFRVPRVSRTLFEGDMAKYRVDRQLQVSRKKNSYVLIDAEATVNGFAEVITQHAPMLEEFSGNQQLDAGILAKSIPRMPNLQTLKVFQGEALNGMGPLLRTHCPLFSTLSFYGWQRPDADQHLATLLSEIKPNSLRSFEVHSTSNIGAETFLALNCHRESLKELKLNDIKADATSSLALLKECTKIHTLLLAERAPATKDLEKDHNAEFLEILAWLRDCIELQTLMIRNLISGPALLKNTLMENNLRLTRLEVENYSMADSKDFHQALAHQPSLLHLSLRGESSESSTDNNVLVDALTKLKNLTELRLREISDNFMNTHIMQLTLSLTQLEVFWTSGYGITDEIWSAVSTLRNLRALEFNALSRFTTTGIVDFILSLEEDSNAGIALLVMMQENDCDISEDDQQLIRETIENKLNGRFQFMLFKGNTILKISLSIISKNETDQFNPDPDAENYSGDDTD